MTIPYCGFISVTGLNLPFFCLSLSAHDEVWGQCGSNWFCTVPIFCPLHVLGGFHIFPLFVSPDALIIRGLEPDIGDLWLLTVLGDIEVSSMVV